MFTQRLVVLLLVVRHAVTIAIVLPVLQSVEIIVLIILQILGVLGVNPQPVGMVGMKVGVQVIVMVVKQRH